MPILLSFLIRFFLGIMVGLVDRFLKIDMLVAGLLELLTTIFFAPNMFSAAYYCSWFVAPSSSIIM